MMDLSRCPCCGSEASFGHVEEDGPNFNGRFVYCTNEQCGLSTDLVFPCGDEPEPILAEKWNRRVQPEPPAGQREGVGEVREAVAIKRLMAVRELVSGAAWSQLGEVIDILTLELSTAPPSGGDAACSMVPKSAAQHS